MKRSRAGITLIEMVAVIVVAGIAIPAVFALWADVSVSSVRSQALADVSFELSSRMEEIKSRRFCDPDIASDALGPESGESGPVFFDDVDDFDGFTFPGGATAEVSYCVLSSGSWEVSTDPGDFKLITVTWSHPSGTAGTATMRTIVSRF